jgi:large subunit ribosomal protein L21
MSRSILRSVLELRTPITRLPPSFLLPQQARRTVTTSITGTNTTANPATSPTAVPNQPPPPPKPTASPPNHQQEPTSEAEARASVAQLLPLLRAQPNHYVTAHIHGFPYLVTAGDHVRLPFKMAGVLPGDVLRLNRASVLGSRDYTLKGAPYIDESLFECRATVLGSESEPMRVKIKTKRRQRRARRVYSKGHYTVLRISELKVL